MNILLWILQGVLALIFLLHGGLFLSPSAHVKEELKKGPFSLGFMRFIGGAELLAALGLILPGWTRILPWLTPLAAVGLFPIMLGALVIHLRQREWLQSGLSVLLVILIVYVAMIRSLVLPL